MDITWRKGTRWNGQVDEKCYVADTAKDGIGKCADATGHLRVRRVSCGWQWQVELHVASGLFTKMIRTRKGRARSAEMGMLRAEAAYKRLCADWGKWND